MHCIPTVCTCMCVCVCARAHAHGDILGILVWLMLEVYSINVCWIRPQMQANPFPCAYLCLYIVRYLRLSVMLFSDTIERYISFSWLVKIWHTLLGGGIKRKGNKESRMNTCRSPWGQDPMLLFDSVCWEECSCQLSSASSYIHKAPAFCSFVKERRQQQKWVEKGGCFLLCSDVLYGTVPLFCMATGFRIYKCVSCYELLNMS